MDDGDRGDVVAAEEVLEKHDEWGVLVLVDGNHEDPVGLQQLAG